MKKLVFFDSDTQCDFVEPSGALYVKGGEKLKPAWKALYALARKKGIRVFGDVDSHYGTREYCEIEKAELQVWGGPFPLHCVRGTPGWEHVKETRLENPLFIPSRPLSAAELEAARAHPGEIIFEKQEYEVSSNKNFAELVKGVEEAIIFGLATDYCVRGAALNLRKLGVAVTVVTDAITAIDGEGGKKALSEMKEAGAKFATTKEILERFG